MKPIWQITTVPAAGSGWSAMQPQYDDDDDKVIDLIADPVIAWLVSVDMEHARSRPYDPPLVTVHAVTCEGIDDGLVLRKPDGRFVLPEAHDFANQREVIEYVNRINERERAAREKADRDRIADELTIKNAKELAAGIAGAAPMGTGSPGIGDDSKN